MVCSSEREGEKSHKSDLNSYVNVINAITSFNELTPEPRVITNESILPQ